MGDIYREMDDEEREKFVQYDNQTKTLLNYFSSTDIDLTQLQSMIKLYDKLFYNINNTYLRSNMYPEYEEIFDRFREISEKVAKFLTTIAPSSNEQIGHKLLQQVFESDVKLSKHPSLLQYFFYIQCEKNKIPYQPMESFVSIENGAITYTNNVVAIRKNLDNSVKDDVNKDIFVLFAILHELEHIKHKLANPNGNVQERLYNLLSRIQPLEDGYEDGGSSHNIGFHTEFPDEVFADVYACKNLLEELQTNYNIPAENMEKIKMFLKFLKEKLLIKNNKGEDNLPTPIEYFKGFVEERVETAPKLTSSEKVRVEVFMQDYLEYVKLEDGVNFA